MIEFKIGERVWVLPDEATLERLKEYITQILVADDTEEDAIDLVDVWMESEPHSMSWNDWVEFSKGLGNHD